MNRSNDGAVAEFFLDDLVDHGANVLVQARRVFSPVLIQEIKDEGVGGNVLARRLVKKDDLGASQQRSSETKQLALAM